MREKSEIRHDCFLLQIPYQPPEHPLLRTRPQDAVMWKVHPAEEVYAGGEGFYENFVWVKG